MVQPYADDQVPPILLDFGTIYLQQTWVHLLLAAMWVVGDVRKGVRLLLCSRKFPRHTYYIPRLWAL